ncbi:PREDICTED: uncharacterized protein LOC108546989 isoform X1 [Eufriesea mexicana]|uniref:uncharacterized protein LOC108546989 isoform X1 n=1 Tax=Eufriesea mexicana TaxID=516756 RepID=UPI00083C8C67|nr:PREDICTED: uncharacterized protein LOC108546989 isoform X1 [Eufriesea mexicana]XP_017754803.1 PREDICTED: uncharacterized protein LOC108546989 isoform X1 [Eufriesea mexicana]
MASDLSSECTETIGVIDEKEEGEISLEDVSSSEEGHLNYGYGTKISQCSNCLSSQHNATWCTAPTKFYPSKGYNRRVEVDLILQDAVQGKENRHQIKESGCIGTKHATSTLQEKNDDLVPISSDSDMEIVGLADNSKQIVIRTSSKSRVKKKRKKKRNHTSVLSINDLVSSSTVDISMKECGNAVKHDVTKNTSRSHHREISPNRRNSRSRVIPRSPPKRHRSLMKTRSPFRRSKSPIIRARSPYRSSTKTMSRKTSHTELMSSHNYVDTHKLLKKVRQLDSMGTHSLEETLNKNKEHASSLKEKLINMVKGISDNNDVTNISKEKSTMQASKKESNDADDEEDLALLRQKALETKQNKSNKQNDQPKIAKNVTADINDDQDKEDLELRMIALRSAVLKKHQNRIQKGIKSGKSKKSNTFRSESPFTQSFLDSIPIPGEELLNFASPPHTPLPVNESNHTEDMELDTDVEREKEKLPYSPTDKITADISIDTELLGIQPSDVSFISLNEANNSPNFNASITTNQDDQKSYQGKIIENRSYLPNIVYYLPSQSPLCTSNANMQYLPNNTETSKSDFMKVHNSHLNVHPYENTCNTVKSNNTSELLDVNSSQEMPYSPTDTPIYDPDLSHALPQTLGPLGTSNSSLVSLESYAFNTHGNNEQCNNTTTQHVATIKQTNNINEDEQQTKTVTTPKDAIVGSTTSLMESVSPSSSMVTIDDLPDNETDINSTDTSRNIKSTEYIPNDLSNNIKEKISEPLYMKGLPDVTKDTNKIPTLINRTLVPAPILKTNKQLQLPLPTRKCTTQQEPTFKSAKMQPVMIDEETSTKTNASFKPIKLMSIPQKSHSVLAIPIAFHDSLHEDTTNETSANKTDTSLVESSPSVALVQNNTTTTSSNKTSDIKTPTQKKKKLVKKGIKRKNTNTAALITKKHNTSRTKNDNINPIDTQIHKSDQVLHTDDKKDQNEIQTQGDSTDSNSIPELKTSKDIVDEKNEISLGTSKEEIQSNNNSSDASEQVKSKEDRRQSVDEDEEALRAILLASLPKRTKMTSNCTNSPAITAVSTTLNQVIVNQTVSNDVNTGNTTNITNTDGTTSLPLPHINSYGSENDKNQSNAGEKINNLAQKYVSTESVKALNTTVGRKRSIPITKGPQKKLIKRVSIPASTKVVNNAKKYQNTMIQKRLNLQKATLYNKQKMAENKILSKMQCNDSKWSVNAKALSDTQRIVINLESDTESDSESEWQKKITIPSAHSLITEKQQSTVNSTAEFEKNLDQFLRAVRKKQESMAAARPTSVSQALKKDSVLTTKPEKLNSSNLHTPLAVRHLPASQQEEYRRLKQQILEREKLKLHRTIENNNLAKNKNVEVSSKSTLSNNSNKELPVKVNQTIPTKSQNINTQLNKENCSKNLVDAKNTTISTSSAQSCINKTCNVDKQENINSNQTKTTSIIANNICVSTESNPNNIGNETLENTMLPINTSQKNVETSTHKIQAKTKASPSLKILSTDEVNRKYVQVQVKNDTNERVVTINNKVILNKKIVINRNENISGSKDSNNKDICDYDMNQLIHFMEGDIITNDTPSGDNDVVDSDASTIILSQRPQERKTSLDASESTISEYQEDTSLNSNTENKHDDYFLLFKNNSSSKDTRSIKENWEVIKKDVKTELNTLITLPHTEQEQRLIDMEQELVMKRYTILDDLAEMSTNLRQWHMERDLQTNLVAEVKKLREQLKVAEERLQMQQNRINNIGPKVVAAHGKINAGRQECFKLATICSTLGNRIVGKEYKVPEAGAQLLDNRLKEVANHTRQLSRKKVPSINIPEICEFSRLEKDTVSTASTETSQSEDLSLEQSNIDKTVLNENDSLIKSNENERPVQIEVATENVNVASKEKDIVLNNSTLTTDEENTSKQNDTEQVLTEHLNDTSIPVTDVLNSEVAQKVDNKVSENNMIKPTTLEPGNEKRNSTRLEGELQMKKTLSYESILTHFKVPRNTNPNGVLCPYELMGTCSDGDCQFIHQIESQTK